MAGFDLAHTARSVLTIKVDTIVRDHMTGKQMLPVPHTLLDIVGLYALLLWSVGPWKDRRGAMKKAVGPAIGTLLGVAHKP